MTIIPFRGLSEKGIIHDPSPYELDANAWSDGSNVWFEDTKVVRAPVVRLVQDNLWHQPWFVWTQFSTSQGYDGVHIQAADGTLRQYVSGVLTDITPAGFTPVSLVQSSTTTFDGDVTYLNNPSTGPFYYGPSSTQYAVLPGWDPTWTCRALRAFGDFLIALNVQKGAVTINNLFKWSDLALDGLPPASWDHTNPNLNAGENPLEQLRSGIVDGLALKSAFVVYSTNESVLVQQTGTQAIFQFSSLYNDGGLIAPNCVEEVQGVHYCFGPNDIYRHDGTGGGKQSIVDGKNRKFIYRNLDIKKSEACFTKYLPFYKKVVFGYPSGESTAAFPAMEGYCNKLAVFDLPSGTMTFQDVPNITGYTLTNLDSALTWNSATTADLPRTWFSTGGSWWDQRAGFDEHPVHISAIGGPVTGSRLCAIDYMNKGSLAFHYLEELNSPTFVQRDGIDLDTVGADLTTYKLIRRIYPLSTMFAQAPMTVQWGGTETPGGNITWTQPHTFDPSTQYKLDDRKGGRFLSVKFTITFPADYEFSGFDADVTSAGRR